MAGLELRSVSKNYGRTEVLHEVDLAIEDGEFVVLVGPSGCGKSTLLRMIAGLEPITAGEIVIDDKVMNDVPPRDRDIAMVFQSYALYPHMSVARNMGFSMEIRRQPAAARKGPIARAAQTLGLGGLLERHPRQLSGGQRQRVAMGRAIVREPKAFLFDEPLSNLDAALRVEMRFEIARLHQRLSTTMIYVTHDQVEAMTLADRIVVLHGGKVQQVGSPLELYDTPANRFVAQFIGSPTMNVFAAPGGQLANGTALSAPPDTAEIGVRPEHLVLTDIDAADIVATAEVVEHLGSDTNIYAVADGIGPVLARIHGNAPIKPGETFGIGLMRDRLHHFDTRGVRL